MNLDPSEAIKPEILLHICCAPDATAVYERLQNEYSVWGYFFNPNIYPLSEYIRRAEEAKRVSEIMGFPLIIPPYLPDAWEEAVRGFENEPEKGKRCSLCFRFNLSATADEAVKRGIPYFTTTLTLSPHKVSKIIFEIGNSAAKEFGVHFLAMDFKKKDGFKRSLRLSRKMQLYRQKYCGCRYSLMNTKERNA